MPKKVYSFRLSEQLMDRFAQVASHLGTSQGAIVEDLMAEFLASYVSVWGDDSEPGSGAGLGGGEQEGGNSESH